MMIGAKKRNKRIERNRKKKFFTHTQILYAALFRTYTLIGFPLFYTIAKIYFYAQINAACGNFLHFRKFFI